MVALGLLVTWPVVPGGPGHPGAPRPTSPAPHALLGPLASPSPTELGHRAPVPGTREEPASGVDPFDGYDHEPAPIGIADFGVSPHGPPYSYTTSAFLGLIDLGSFAVAAPSGVIYGPESTIELNLVLEFRQAGSLYQYWIQNFANYDTADRQPLFGDNVWNLSNSISELGDGGPTGNGSIYAGGDGEFYYAGAGSRPGNGATLPAGGELDLLANASTHDGLPAVTVAYRDGFGWRSYDLITFPFATGATGVAFLVNGSTMNGAGLFDDAELTLGGGSGSATTAKAANVSMALDRYNGHNFEAVPNAYNFGGDTSETISNVTTSLGSSSTNASLDDEVSTGSGAPAALYNASDRAVVDLTTDVPSATLEVGAGPGVPYSGGAANVTIAPGRFAFSLTNGTGPVAETVLSLAGGSVRSLALDAAPVFAVDFVASGFLNATAWNATLDGTTLGGTGGTRVFYAANGSYPYEVPSVPGYRSSAAAGNLSVNGTGATVDVDFAPVLYDVVLRESGLPEGTNWSVTAYQRTTASTGPTIALGLPNGSWAYRVGGVPGGLTAWPNGTGTLAVDGAGLLRTLTFYPFRLPVVVNATGLPAETAWGLVLGNDSVNGTGAMLWFLEPNGTYPFRVRAPDGWSASPPNGTLRVDGALVAIAVRFVPITYPVTFTASGLPEGARWAVVVEGTRATSTTSTLVLELPNGTYGFSIDAPVGYAVANASTFGPLLVDGAGADVALTFAPVPPSYGTVEGTVVPSNASLLVDGAPANLSDGAFDLRLPVGPHELELEENGYDPWTATINVAANSSIALGRIVLVPSVGSEPPGATAGTGAGASPLGVGTIVGIAVPLAVGALAALALLRRRRPRAPR